MCKISKTFTKNMFWGRGTWRSQFSGSPNLSFNSIFHKCFKAHSYISYKVRCVDQITLLTVSQTYKDTDFLALGSVPSEIQRRPAKCNKNNLHCKVHQDSGLMLGWKELTHFIL